ncbi:MAG: aspartate racemase FomE protein [Sulfobacillus thermosulfidooxidans]|nr:MAG: aspartate racemase FomE protein [Sulfobacillus thermosulfidooxidans]
MRTAGIIAGLGPLAGAYFYRRLIELTPAHRDEDHIPVILLSSPQIPSRIAHLEHRGPSPLPTLIHAAQTLVQAGAEFLVMPSSTTHAYYDALSQAVSVPWLNMLAVVSDTIASHGIHRLAIMATTPTVQYHLYDSHLLARQITPVLPDATSQMDIMNIIERVKGQDDLVALGQALYEIAQRPWSATADGLLLACTEIPVVFPVASWNQPAIFSATDILAQHTAAWSGLS